MIMFVAILIVMAIAVAVAFAWFRAYQKKLNLDKLHAVLESLIEREMKVRLSEVDSSLKDVAGLLDDLDDGDPRVRAIRDPLVRHICGFSSMVEGGIEGKTYESLARTLDQVESGIGEALEDVRQIVKDAIADSDLRT